MTIEDAIDWLEAIYGPFGPDSAVGENEIAAAEQRLGRRLPRALAVYYRRTGGAVALHSAHDQLVPLGQIDVEGDHLVFYQENQGVCVWGIACDRLAEDDPPVDRADSVQGEATATFCAQSRSVSEFAAAQGAWQAVMGALPFVGSMLEAPEPSKAAAANSALGPPWLLTQDHSAWLVEGGVAVITGGTHIGLATRTSEQFIAASQLLGLAIEEWDYATMTDR